MAKFRTCSRLNGCPLPAKYKNEEDPIKNEGARVFKTSYINFSDAQRQITPESAVVSGRIPNSFTLSCISSSPAKNEDDSIKK